MINSATIIENRLQGQPEACFLFLKIALKYQITLAEAKLHSVMPYPAIRHHQ